MKAVQHSEDELTANQTLQNSVAHTQTHSSMITFINLLNKYCMCVPYVCLILKWSICSVIPSPKANSHKKSMDFSREEIPSLADEP